MAGFRVLFFLLALSAATLAVKAAEESNVIIDATPETSPEVLYDTSDEEAIGMTAGEDTNVIPPDVMVEEGSQRAAVNEVEGAELFNLARLFFKHRPCGGNKCPTKRTTRKTTCKTTRKTTRRTTCRTTRRTTCRTTRRTTCRTTRRTTCRTTRRTTRKTTRRTTCKSTRRTTRRTTRKTRHYRDGCGRPILTEKKYTCQEFVAKKIAPRCGGQNRVKFVGKHVGDSCIEVCQYNNYQQLWFGSLMFDQKYYFECSKGRGYW